MWSAAPPKPPASSTSVVSMGHQLIEVTFVGVDKVVSDCLHTDEVSSHSPQPPEAARMSKRSRITLAIASVAIFMVTLDNLVVTTALPSIRRDLGASLEDLEWTVNGYTLAFAVLLLTGAALGDRFGRRRMFLIGIGVFTGASAFAAVAPSTDALIAARAVQGLGGAIVAPLTLTLLSE